MPFFESLIPSIQSAVNIILVTAVNLNFEMSTNYFLCMHPAYCVNDVMGIRNNKPFVKKHA